MKVTWASRIDLKSGRPVENSGARYPNGKTFTMWPSPVGAHTWLPMAFNPKTRLVYIPAIEMATSYNDVGITRENWRRAPGSAVEGAANPDFVVPDAGPTTKLQSLHGQRGGRRAGFDRHAAVGLEQPGPEGVAGLRRHDLRGDASVGVFHSGTGDVTRLGVHPRGRR
ncbi:hypothetical protein [Novosphingobium sp. BL-52-GroH]|uniref:hypothetical protein n=1 Tax=Novosphingobium sp. BL-52-GroH TaxID=3349877 RepID=UPI0038510D69